MTGFFPKSHTILEKGCMDYRPFGVDPQGHKIRDVSGATVRANVEYLEEAVAHAQGPEAGPLATETLSRLLNERIRDQAYHVTPAFLKNAWNSYSYEFTCFLGELCKVIVNDPQFPLRVGKEKFLSPMIQTLGRPFSVAQIYRMFPHFGEKFVKGSVLLGAGLVTDHSAVLRMKFTEHVYEQFGPYRKACAALACQSAKGGLAAVPERIHHLGPATVHDLACIAEGDEWCEWEFRWAGPAPRRRAWPITGVLVSAAGFAYLRVRHPAVSAVEALLIALFPGLAIWLARARRALGQEVKDRERLIREQLTFVEAGHEELREAYLEQEQAAVDLKRTVRQLTLLHHTGLIASSTLDRETLLQVALRSIKYDLNYDRVMIAFYDPGRQVAYDARILRVPDEVAAFARSIEAPITGPPGIEAKLFLEGSPILLRDIREVWDRLHPVHRQLASLTRAKSLISVPLKVQDRIIGALTVDRLQDHALGQDDLDLMVTVASQLAIALEHAAAYRQIEELNVGLEAKVHERTAEIKAANEQLKQMDQLKSQFLAHVSHELRTPLTSIRGFAENMLKGIAGPLSEKQKQYLTRVVDNGERLGRMIGDLLDRSRIDAGKIELSLGEVILPGLAADVIEQLRPLALAKRQRLELQCRETDLSVCADADKVSQILTNLVDNAMKYTPEAGSITVLVGLDRPHFARVSVVDTGEGIPPQALPRLFDPFFRASHRQRSQVKGLGLGLSITKTLVELHGGQISVQSEEGRGTTVEFTLPLRRTVEGPTPGASQAHSQTPLLPSL